MSPLFHFFCRLSAFANTSLDILLPTLCDDCGDDLCKDRCATSVNIERAVVDDDAAAASDGDDESSVDEEACVEIKVLNDRLRKSLYLGPDVPVCGLSWPLTRKLSSTKLICTKLF